MTPEEWRQLEDEATREAERRFAQSPEIQAYIRERVLQRVRQLMPAGKD
jgi:hypothetical protein